MIKLFTEMANYSMSSSIISIIRDKRKHTIFSCRQRTMNRCYCHKEYLEETTLDMLWMLKVIDAMLTIIQLRFQFHQAMTLSQRRQIIQLLWNMEVKL